MSRIPADSYQASVSGVRSFAGSNGAARTRARSCQGPTTRRDACVHLAGLLLAAALTLGSSVSRRAMAISAQPAPVAAADVLPATDAATIHAILALDADHVSAAEVRDVLSRAPAPRIIALHGSIALTTMQPFAEFLMAMGYPAERLRDPKDGSLSHSSFVDSRKLAGTLAWYYEREGMVPLLIGHSQGGMVAIKVLHELAGNFDHTLEVWNPIDDRWEQRTTIIDPATHSARSVVDAVQITQHSRHRRRVHRILHRMGSYRGRHPRNAGLRRRRYGTRAQHRATGTDEPYCFASRRPPC